MEKTWLKQYPAGVPAEIDVEPVSVAGRPARRELSPATRDRTAYKFMGKAISFAQVDEASRALAAWLQAQGLDKGDRVAVMMPNVPQYPVAIAGDPARRACGGQRQPALHAARARAPAQGFGRQGDRHRRELRQHAAAGDGGGADQEGRARGDGRHARLSEVADRQLRRAQGEEDGAGVRPAGRGALQRRARRKGAARPFKPAEVGPDDIAVLQYTGGTTGVSKGAVLLHRNLVANILQSEAWYQPALKKIPTGEQVVTICALPIYHIFGFNTNVMLGMRMGGCQHPDPQPARPAGRVQGAAAARSSTASRRSTRSSTRWPTTPTSARSTGAAS